MNQQILGKMQTAFTLFNALGAIAGDKTIISGCVLTGTTVSDGVVFIGGEVFEFRGGVQQATVIVREVLTNLVFENNNSYPVVKTRFVQFGVGQDSIPWEEFKRGFPTKNFEAKMDEALEPVLLRIAKLEKKNAVFAAGGGMVLFQKPANQIPPGWAEVVNWRGRLPMGWKPEDADFGVVGALGGAKSTNLAIPISGYGVGGETSGLPSGQLLVTSGAQEMGEYLESVRKASSAPSAISANVLNPFRIVIFIEYIE